MSRQINFIGDGVQTLIACMMTTKKNTWFGSKIQLMTTIRTKQRVAFTTKDSQNCVSWFLLIKCEEGGGIVKDGSRQSINNVDSTKKGINPIAI
jgi:hypothetical protein